MQCEGEIDSLDQVISRLNELLKQERGNPESMANGHGFALGVAIRLLTAEACCRLEVYPANAESPF